MVEAILNGVRLHEKLFALLFHIEAAACVVISRVVVIVGIVIVAVVVMSAIAITICRIDRPISYFRSGVAAWRIVLFWLQR